VFEGNRPSNIILADSSPGEPGQTGRTLRAFRVHQGTIWIIDSFDQWGVELGKVLAKKIIGELESTAEPELAHDSSTNSLIRRFRQNM
jgi:glucose-6-phosphate isomerase